MNVEQAYDQWSGQYDANVNRTRDLEAVSLRETLTGRSFGHCLKQKLEGRNVVFSKGDIVRDDDLLQGPYDLVVFSLVLEHVEDLSLVISKVAGKMASGGLMYIGELHPFKQYSGSKARFQTEDGEQVVTCFNHHVTDFTNAAVSAGLQLLSLKEYFDDGDRNAIPRILTLLLQNP